MTGSHGYKKILGPEDDRNLTRSVWVPADQFNEWQRVKSGKDGNYYMTSLFRSVIDMAKTPGARMPVSQAGRYGDFDMSYQVSPASKDIYLNLVALSNESQSCASRTPGVYRVEWNGDAIKGNWSVRDGSYTDMDLSHQWGGAHSAVIPGKFKNKEDAGRKIANHLENAYFPQTRQRNAIHENNNHFSMFWLNNEFTSETHVKSLVSMMQMARKQSAELQWLVHGEACGTFVRAAEYLKKNPVSDNPHEAQKGFELQSFYFSNPRGRRTGKSDLEKICKEVGFKYENVKINDKDIFKNADARKSALFKSALTVASISGGVLSGSSISSALGDNFIGLNTMMQIKDAISAGHVTATTAGITICGGVVLVGAAYALEGLGRHLGGVYSTAFRDGNQNWAA